MDYNFLRILDNFYVRAGKSTKACITLESAVWYTVKLGIKEQIGIKEPFPVTNLPFTS
jgi:hypothetical protein